eukprot:1394050-Amorphochlora_amoeboformis.AAC.1
MAGSVAEGVKSGGAKVKIMRIPETLGEEVLKKMHAKAKNPDHPVVTPEDIKGADGVIFGIPTRFGMASAQLALPRCFSRSLCSLAHFPVSPSLSLASLTCPSFDPVSNLPSSPLSAS